MRQDLTTASFPRTTVKGGVGLYDQPQPFSEVDQVVRARRGSSATASVHYSLGLEQEVMRHVDVSVETFYKSLDRLVVQDAGNTGDGRVVRLEWLLRWKNDRSCSVGSRTRSCEASDARSKPSYLHLFQYDQTHILTAIVSRDVRRRVAHRRALPPRVGQPLHAAATTARSTSTARPISRELLPAVRRASARSTSSTSASTRRSTRSRSSSRRTSTFRTSYFHRSQEGISYNFNYTQSPPVLGLPILPNPRRAR